ncbi:acyl-CoA dehydrogenase [Salinisphaera orenii MK-B5]|uniref:Acyl-CoA dehydrogenase n=1 Tax=Salinisphaera orenii MK-B5 TaxID=856730 RepID=A0A423PND7_9GAMM|nr:acyl-CoA dehydrogenase family protein [Salinisphaera orenii]ROO27135.1 acyl-CoA dehydrogenase [Salinisphaera orenii MK-B5]
MNFDLPADMAALKEATADFATRRLTEEAEAFERSGEFAYDLIRAMGETGLFGAPFPEDLGGSAAGFLAVSVIAEEVSRIAPAYGYAMNMQCATCPYTIYNWGSPAQVERFVPGLIAGESIGMFALSEAGGGSDPAGAMRTTARREGDHYVLNGSKMWITFSHAADVGVLFARTDPKAEPAHRGISAFIVEPKRFEGYTAQPIDLPGLSKSLRSCEIFLDDFKVPVENRLGDEGEGFKIAMNALEYGRLTVSARLTGIAQAALDASVAYANERFVGGGPIARHQLVQERIADATVAVEAARLMAYRIGWTMDQGRVSTRVASRAKYFATQAARLAGDVAREVFGGNALAAEYPVQRLNAYIDMLTVGEGSENVQRILIGEDALGIKDATRHTMRNRFVGAG